MVKHSSSSSSSCFVVDVEMLADDVADSKWEAQHIYQVPEWLKGDNTNAYKPQLVSLGPFHHGDSNLLPMEEHKRRALVHVVKRSNKPLEHFLAAINSVAEELLAEYGNDLDDYRSRNDEQSFIDMMLMDGCFLLMFMSRSIHGDDYDPVFSMHGRNSLLPVIRSDMLLIENQLPLLVLKKILRIVLPNYPEDVMDEHINLMVLRFLGRELEGRDIAAISLRPHPLELYHRSLTYRNGDISVYSRSYKYEMIPSALEMHEADVKFRPSKANKLRDIHFEPRTGVLSMPVVVVDDNTKSLYLNLMAFERLNSEAGDLVTAYVICMDNMIVSAKDVAMLSSNGVLKNMLGCDEETAELFNGTLSRGQLKDECGSLPRKVQHDVKAYCSKRRHKWRATLIRTYFRNPWAIISLAAAVVLLIATLLQTVYTIMSCK